ncbi:DUF433 domain-containing protein [Algoriphagus sp.]|uniref:DUF433 domain-containing protein n=1 Tax=Algoriphagus sp. TaxID=1872435 RepID=UPI00391C908D
MDLISRITIEAEICHGKPCVRGMRWPVEVILDMLGSGMTTEEILEDHPELEREDILASLQFAKLSLSGTPLSELAS